MESSTTRGAYLVGGEQATCDPVSALTPLPTAVPPPRPKAELRRVSVRAHNTELRCDVVSGIGFSWRCTCGARGRITGSRAVALAGKREHEAEHR